MPLVIQANNMEIVCVPRLSKEQEKNLPNDYPHPLVEGMYDINDDYPEGLITIYVGYCDWEKNFELCLKEFVLTMFHEVMHVLCPEMENHVPYAEKILAEILNDC